MKHFIFTTLCLFLFLIPNFAQEDCHPTFNGQFTGQQVDCQLAQYSVKGQINITDWDTTEVIEYVKFKFKYNQAGLAFVDAYALTFIAPDYTTNVWTTSSDKYIWIELTLNPGATGVTVGTTYVDLIQFNFTILDCYEFSDLCLKAPKILRVVGISGDCTFGEWYCDETPLPVELTSFTANTVNDNVVLDWTTATELNNYGFNVQRDGETIGFVPGYGNSNSPKVYTFKDVITKSGTYSYRLQQVDNDGTSELSKEVFVEIDLNRFELLQNYPNPFNPSTVISFYLNKAETVKLVVYDIIGNEVAILADGIYEEGYNEVVFSGTNLTSGTYIYRLQAESGSVTKMMLLVK